LTGGHGRVAFTSPFAMKAGYIVRLAGFVANIVRLALLASVTCYLVGDRVAQGFLHGLAGIALMFVALIAFVVVDGLVCWLIRPKYANATATEY
jgi:exosortase/archaeosortase family protein